MSDVFQNSDREYTPEEKEKLKELMKGISLLKSGYGGVLQNGNIVDRREHPTAIPIQENSMFGVPKPIKL